MTKSTSDQIEQEIKTVEQEIQKLEEEFLAKSNEIVELKNEINRLEGIPLWSSQDNLTPAEIIKLVNKNGRDWDTRKLQIEGLDQTIVNSKRALREIKTLLASLQSKLLSLKEDREWSEKYAPYQEQYRQAFEDRTPEQKVLKQQRTFEIEDKISCLSKDLSLRQSQLDLAVNYLNKFIPDYRGRFAHPLSGQPETDKNTLQNLISDLETQIETIESTAITEEKAAFRRYVRSRFELQKTLERLITAQNDYSLALAQFKALATNYPESLDFESEVLGLKNQVIILESGKVDLLNKEGEWITAKNLGSALSKFPQSDWR